MINSGHVQLYNSMQGVWGADDMQIVMHIYALMEC